MQEVTGSIPVSPLFFVQWKTNTKDSVQRKTHDLYSGVVWWTLVYSSGLAWSGALARLVYFFVVWRTGCKHQLPTAAKCSPAGIRTRVLWVKATYPNRLDYGGTTTRAAIWHNQHLRREETVFATHTQHTTHNITTQTDTHSQPQNTSEQEPKEWIQHHAVPGWSPTPVLSGLKPR